MKASVLVLLTIFTHVALADGTSYRNVDAHHCEFYVSGFAKAHFSEGAANEGWFESHLKVNVRDLVILQNGTILKVGAYYETADLRTGKSESHWVDGQSYGSQAGFYQIRMSTMSGVRGFLSELTEFAYFVDVERSDRSVDRIWHKNGNLNFTLKHVWAGYPSTRNVLGQTEYEWIEEPSPVFNQRRACL